MEQGQTHQGLRVGKSPDDILGKLSHEVFKYDCLDRRLKRHHVTGKFLILPPILLAHVRQESHSRVQLESVSFRPRDKSSP